jgi:hypothetical protein
MQRTMLACSSAGPSAIVDNDGLLWGINPPAFLAYTIQCVDVEGGVANFLRIPQATDTIQPVFLDYPLNFATKLNCTCQLPSGTGSAVIFWS